MRRSHCDSSAVEWRQRQQIEDCQDDVDEQCISQIFSKPLCSCFIRHTSDRQQFEGCARNFDGVTVVCRDPLPWNDSAEARRYGTEGMELRLAFPVLQ
jgi:hypothetical protein